jgi:hypothetical protein
VTVPVTRSPDLPHPDSEEIASILPDAHRLIYRYLYQRRDDPPTMRDIRRYVEESTGEAPVQTDRRLRDLRQHFDVLSKIVKGRGHVYVLTVRSENSRKGTRRAAISSRVEAEIFERDGYFCAMCGDGPKDGVKLVIDHRIPVEWGGTNEPSNLQVLCGKHNHGKQSHFASFDKYGDAIKQAIGLDEVHMRIGKLLVALKGYEVPVELINTVAREQNMGDPTKRMRELRQLGWTIENKVYRVQGGRTRSVYILTSSQPWPPEGPRAAVNRLEAQRKHRLKAVLSNKSKPE